VTIQLTSHGGSNTEIDLTHEHLPVDQAKPHASGWIRILEHLDEYLARK
jgi:hypothetical protein